MRALLLLVLLPMALPAQPPRTETAIFASGCFWCTEADFEKLPGVISAVSGYTGGDKPKPTYEEVSSGATGHTEAVKLTFDPGQVSYEKLLEHYWKNSDPTDGTGQFCDTGSQYRPAIFYLNAEQQKLAEDSLARLKASGRFKEIHTQIVAAEPFYLAEQYHQDYYKKNPVRYKFYRANCGRDARLKQLWGDQAVQ